jgi:uncharacterized membrane protein YbhN (UPF0104 family)
MRLDFQRIGLGVALAAVLLFALGKVAGVSLADLRAVSPQHVLMALLFAMLTVFLRAANYRAIGGAAPAADTRPGLSAWLHLSLRHQFLFTAIPSGLGDLGFPVLARRHVGLRLAEGAAVIAVARLRDICVLLSLGGLSLAVLGHLPLIFAASAVCLGLAGLFAEHMVAVVRRLGQSFGVALFRDVAVSAQTVPRQLGRMALSCASWASAVAALWAAFAAAGHSLALAEAVLLLVALNLIGVVSISVGGLGVAEAGSAGVLVWLGLPLDTAVALSLVARPLLLGAVLGACVAWWMVLHVQVWATVRARLQGSRLVLTRVLWP